MLVSITMWLLEVVQALHVNTALWSCCSSFVPFQGLADAGCAGALSNSKMSVTSSNISFSFVIFPSPPKPPAVTAELQNCRTVDSPHYVIFYCDLTTILLFFTFKCSISYMLQHHRVRVNFNQGHFSY